MVVPSSLSAFSLPITYAFTDGEINATRANCEPLQKCLLTLIDQGRKYRKDRKGRRWEKCSLRRIEEGGGT